MEPSNVVIELYYLVYCTHQVLIVMETIVGMGFFTFLNNLYSIL